MGDDTGIGPLHRIAHADIDGGGHEYTLGAVLHGDLDGLAFRQCGRGDQHAQAGEHFGKGTAMNLHRSSLCAYSGGDTWLIRRSDTAPASKARGLASSIWPLWSTMSALTSKSVMLFGSSVMNAAPAKGLQLFQAGEPLVL